MPNIFNREKGSVFIPLTSDGNALDRLEGHGKVGWRETIGSYMSFAKKRARQVNPIAANQADFVNWVEYDRWTVAANSASPSNFKYFTQPIGTNSKTKTDTNLEQVQRLPDPYWMNVVGIGFYPSSNMVKADLDSLFNGYYHEFYVGNKIYAEGPLQCFPAAAGLTGVTTQTTVGAWNNGVPRTDNFFDVRLPAGLNLGTDPRSGGALITDGLIGITILQGQQFRVEMSSPSGTFTTAAAGGGINLACYLYGILSRSVQ